LGSADLALPISCHGTPFKKGGWEEEFPAAMRMGQLFSKPLDFFQLRGSVGVWVACDPLWEAQILRRMEGAEGRMRPETCFCRLLGSQKWISDNHEFQENSLQNSRKLHGV